MSKAEKAKLPPLTMPRPSGPPPKRLQVIDLRKGSGPPVPKRDWISNREEVYIRYVRARYPEARAGRLTGPFSSGRLLLAESSKGLARGLAGMKVGGRRELIVPPRLAYPRWQPSWGYASYFTVYVVDLVGMEPPPDRRVEYRHRTWHPCYFQARSAPAGKRSSPAPTVQMTKAEVAKLPSLKIPTASGPPPRRLEVIDLRKGSGPAVAKTDAVSIRWIEDTYPQALKGRQGALSGGEVSWKSWRLEEASRAFEVGLPHMRVGGRRELIVPPKVAYPRWKPSWGYAPYVSVYVVDLLGVEPRD